MESTIVNPIIIVAKRMIVNMHCLLRSLAAAAGRQSGATAMPSPRSFEWVRIQTTKPTLPQNLFSSRISALNLENVELNW